jgi:hypothetical protein
MDETTALKNRRRAFKSFPSPPDFSAPNLPHTSHARPHLRQLADQQPAAEIVTAKRTNPDRPGRGLAEIELVQDVQDVIPDDEQGHGADEGQGDALKGLNLADFFGDFGLFGSHAAG